MSQVLIDPSSLTAIGEAIRSKNKQTVKYKPNEMAGAIKALALDNSVTIQSNDAWKYAVDSALEHQSITVKVSGKLTGDNTTGYKGEVIFDPYITTNFGWLAGKITKTVDKTNHVVTFSAEAATELSGVLKDGWTPVYVVDGKYYTTTTPDNIESLKEVSSSDNIENLLICGYYTLDKSTNKLVATEPITYSDSTHSYPVNDTATKKLRDNYLTDVGDYSLECWTGVKALEELYIPNVKSIGDNSVQYFKNLKILHVPNLETLNGTSNLRDNHPLTSYYLPKLKVVPELALAGGYPYHEQIIYLKDVTSFGGDNFNGTDITLIIDNEAPPEFKLDSDSFELLTILVPNSAVDTYKNNASFSKVLSSMKNVTIESMDDYDININQENSQVTVTEKKTLTSLFFTVNKNTSKTMAHFSTKDHSQGPICVLSNHDANNNDYSRIFNIDLSGASLVLNTSASLKAIKILRNHDLKLAFGDTDGVFNNYNYTKDQKDITTSGTFIRDKIEFTSYTEYKKTLAKLKENFDNGQDLYCKILLS